MVQNPQWALPVLVAMFASALCAQESRGGQVRDAAVKLPEFEVASVKPTDMRGDILVYVRVYPGGRVEVSGCELSCLIRIAFGLSYQKITGGADWTDEIKYQVEAVPPKDSGIQDFRYGSFKIADARLRGMLQALLITRFQLKFHWETRTGEVYLLKLGSKPPAFHSTSVDASSPAALDGSIYGSIRQWVLHGATMADVAQFASTHILGVPVLDRTGLSGRFDYKQSPTEPYKPSRPDMSQAESYSEFSSAYHSSFMNFLQELHLRLERTKGPVETFVIDGAEKPSPN